MEATLTPHPELSVVVVAQDEESNIGRCLASVAGLADEIIVIDGESQDSTVSVASKFTEKIFVQPFQGHIEQKNYGLGKASKGWVLSLDADECLSDELKSNLISAFPDLCSSYAGFVLNRRNLFLGRWMRHGGWYPDRKLRLVRRASARWDGRNPHDRLTLSEGGSVGRLEGDILHYTSPDLKTHLRKQRRHSRTTALERVKCSETVSSLEFWWHPLLAFFRSYILLQGFRDGRHGLALAALTAFYRLQIAVQTWEFMSDERGHDED